MRLFVFLLIKRDLIFSRFYKLFGNSFIAGTTSSQAAPFRFRLTENQSVHSIIRTLLTCSWEFLGLFIVPVVCLTQIYLNCV